jgi:hypothetical protein
MLTAYRDESTLQKLSKVMALYGFALKRMSSKARICLMICIDLLGFSRSSKFFVLSWLEK